MHQHNSHLQRKYNTNVKLNFRHLNRFLSLFVHGEEYLVGQNFRYQRPTLFIFVKVTPNIISQYNQDATWFLSRWLQTMRFKIIATVWGLRFVWWLKRKHVLSNLWLRVTFCLKRFRSWNYHPNIITILPSVSYKW